MQAQAQAQFSSDGRYSKFLFDTILPKYRAYRRLDIDHAQDHTSNFYHKKNSPKKHLKQIDHASQLFRNKNMLMFLGLILFLLAEISSPALLNSLSDGTEVATVQLEDKLLLPFPTWGKLDNFASTIEVDPSSY